MSEARFCQRNWVSHSFQSQRKMTFKKNCDRSSKLQVIRVYTTYLNTNVISSAAAGCNFTVRSWNKRLLDSDMLMTSTVKDEKERSTHIHTHQHTHTHTEEVLSSPSGSDTGSVCRSCSVCISSQLMTHKLSVNCPHTPDTSNIFINNNIIFSQIFWYINTFPHWYYTALHIIFLLCYYILNCILLMSHVTAWYCATLKI